MILAAQLILSLSILIVLHEMGHFLPARLFKIRVEKFYLFFDPWFSLIKKKIGETEYGIGWLPLGGYVKISGMVDESMDKEQMKLPPQAHEFRSKPAWQRLIVMIGGVTVNVILGIIIYGMVLGAWGKEILPVNEMTYGVHCDSLMYQFGFRDGDKILKVDGQVPNTFGAVNKALFLYDAKTVTVERFGQPIDLQLPDEFGQMLVDSGARAPFFERIPCVVDTVLAESNALKAGLLKGDSIAGVGDLYSGYFQDIQRYIERHKNEIVDLHVVRDSVEHRITVMVNEEGKIGFGPKGPREYLKYDTLHYSFGQALQGGFTEAWSTVTDYVIQLEFLFSKAGAKQIGGFISIAKIFPDEWDWWAFWLRTALLSLILAFMNLLPIPALDGGHVMFLLWEMITGKAVSQKILERAQFVGMVLLLGLIIYANGMDIFRLF